MKKHFRGMGPKKHPKGEYVSQISTIISRGKLMLSKEGSYDFSKEVRPKTY